MIIADVEAIFVAMVGADDAGAEVVAVWRGDGCGWYTGTGRGGRGGVGTSERQSRGEKKGDESEELGAHFGRARQQRSNWGQQLYVNREEMLRTSMIMLLGEGSFYALEGREDGGRDTKEAVP